MVKEIIPEYRNQPGAAPTPRPPVRARAPAVPRRPLGRNLGLVLVVALLLGAAVATSWTAGVFNQTPVARLSASESLLFSGGSVVFDASNSSDPEGALAHCHWNFGDDFNSIESKDTRVAHNFTRAGQFRPCVSVEDARGAISGTVFAAVVVLPRPESDRHSAPTFSDFNFSVDTTGLAGVPVNFSWAFSDGSPVAHGPSVERRFREDGQVEVTLGASCNGRTARASLLVSVLNRAPSASLEITPDIPRFANQELVFDGSASTDIDGDITRWWWDPGDGSPSGTGEPVLRHKYLSSGFYTVELEISDNDGATSIVKEDIVVMRDLSITGFNASVFRDGSGVARADVMVAFCNNGDAKAAGSIKVAVTACAPDRCGIQPVEESSITEPFPDPVYGASSGLTVVISGLLVYDPDPGHTNYYVGLYYLDRVADSGWYPR